MIKIERPEDGEANCDNDSGTAVHDGYSNENLFSILDAALMQSND
jgi:hypothetical protein